MARGSNIAHFLSGLKPMANLKWNNEVIWRNTDPPTISAFTANASTIDLDPDDNTKTASVTFTRERTGVYIFLSNQYQGATPQGSVTGFPQLVTISHYYIGTSGRLSAPPSDSHYYQFAVRNTDPNYASYTSIEINGRTFALGKSTSDFNERGIGGREYWTTDRIPNSADWVTDGRLTLSIKFKMTAVTSTIRLSFAVTAQAGKALSAQVYNAGTGAEIGTRFVAAAGSGISEVVNAPTPNQSSTTYRVIAKNSGGASHKDLSVTATKDPTIANLRRTRYIAPIPGYSPAQYTFGMTITGLPRPTATYTFSGGQNGTIDARHFTQGANPYTWTVNFPQSFATVTAQSLTVTVTNASGSANARIANIND